MRLTVTDIAKLRAAGEKITMLTAYDASFAALADAAGVELLLAGDSLGMASSPGRAERPRRILCPPSLPRARLMR